MAVPRREKIGGEQGPVGWRFDAKNEMAQAYAARQAARYVTKVSAETKAELQGIISKSIREGINARDTAKLIKSTVGLNGPQGAAVNNYYKNLLARGTDPGRAWALADKYSDKLLKSRAKTISRTEIMGALNGGALEQARQRRDAGLYLNPHKKWKITQDEVTCKICRPLEGQLRKLEDAFPTGVLAPPTHPNCRCTLSFLDPLLEQQEQEERDLAEYRRLKAEAAEVHMFSTADGEARVRTSDGMVRRTSLMDAMNDPKVLDITYDGFIQMHGDRIQLKIVLSGQMDQAASWGRSLGRRTTFAERLSATGFHVPKGAKNVAMSASDGSSLKLTVRGPDSIKDSITMQRFWRSPWIDGRLYQENSYMGVQGIFARKGFAREVMRRSVKNASALGVQDIRLLAEGNLHDAAQGTWNGYYTWPRLGFRGRVPVDLIGSIPVPDSDLRLALANKVISKREFDKYTAWNKDKQTSIKHKIQQELTAAGFNVATDRQINKEIEIAELMKSETGRSIWKVYGLSRNLSFDLTPGSVSRTGLEAYLAARP
jgi:SPP1 gp7 family putative phage head morphogenesis protein